MGLSKEEVYIGDFADEAEHLAKTYGTTDLFSTGHGVLDRYLHGNPNKHVNYRGGFGRKDGYEIMLIYGPTGAGKSTVALNFLAPAIMAGKRVGLLVLEDDMADASVRLKLILGDTDWKKMNAANTVVCLPRDAMTKKWQLPELLKYIEDWFVEQKVDLILLDHLQFAFENAEAVKGENEYSAQRVFMRDLNGLMKRVKKTIIMISHVNKAVGAKGMDRVMGSGSLAQAATKVIEIGKDKDTRATTLYLRKSRFTPTPDWDYHMMLNNSRLEPIV